MLALLRVNRCSHQRVALILEEKTSNGSLHNRVAELLEAYISSRDERIRLKVLDLGAGTGAFTQRLLQRFSNTEITCCDKERIDIQCAGLGAVRFVYGDLNKANFCDDFEGRFDVVVSIEVLEHLHSPAAFLKNIENLLKPGGAAFITSPNVQSIISRLVFLLSGNLRGFSARHEPTHITPIFFELIERLLLERPALSLTHYEVVPRYGFRSRKRCLQIIYTAVSYALFPFLRGRRYKFGNNQIYVLEKKT